MSYLQTNPGGITIFGWTVDRALINTIFFIELSLVTFVLGKTIVVSSSWSFSFTCCYGNLSSNVPMNTQVTTPACSSTSQRHGLLKGGTECIIQARLSFCLGLVPSPSDPWMLIVHFINRRGGIFAVWLIPLAPNRVGTPFSSHLPFRLYIQTWEPSAKSSK